MDNKDLFQSGEDYQKFIRENCEQCKKGSVLVEDFGDCEKKTKYRCRIQKEIDDCLCEGITPSWKTMFQFQSYIPEELKCLYKE